MANSSPDSKGSDSQIRPDSGSPPSTPLWVKVFAIIALAVIVMIVIMLLTGHGPGNHMHMSAPMHMATIEHGVARKLSPGGEWRA